MGRKWRAHQSLLSDAPVSLVYVVVVFFFVGALPDAVLSVRAERFSFLLNKKKPLALELVEAQLITAL